MVINGASTLPWPIHLPVEPPLQLRPWWCLSFYEAAAGALVVQVTHWTSRCPFLISVGCIHLAAVECSLFQLINEECQTIACQLQFVIAGVQLINVCACLKWFRKVQFPPPRLSAVRQPFPGDQSYSDGMKLPKLVCSPFTAYLQ